MLHFGTDGIRGDAESQLNSRLVVCLARAFVTTTGAQRVLLALDGRESGPRIERDLATGFAQCGARSESLGLLPTPGLALLARELGVFGAMISASHNRFSDNGVKFFEPDGSKLSDEHQRAIEEALQRELQLGDPAGHRGVEPESVSREPTSVAAADRYVAFLAGQVPPKALSGLRVVLDLGNGAASQVAPLAFRTAGAEVVEYHSTPDGRNINDDCGSTHPAAMQRAVIEHRADLGLAFDGDADRVLAADERGDLVDGDQIMAIMAIALHERAGLPNAAIAATVLSNFGLRRALSERGIRVFETPVGDRHVVAAMREHELALGGEQSGHIVFGTRASTGDGTLTGLLLAHRVADSGEPLSRLAAVMTKLPQVMVNVRAAGPIDVERHEPLQEAIRVAEADLAAGGRILVRASGTEPLVRVMVEAESLDRADEIARRVAGSLEGA